MSSLVSIVVPTYNRSSLIEETLDSIRGQTYSPIEVLVVDDGSTDGTQEVVRKWMKNPSPLRARLLDLPGNVGKPAAVNLAFGQIAGEFVMVLDSDDVLLADAIAVEHDFLQKHAHVGMVCGLAFEMKGKEKTSNVIGVSVSDENIEDLTAIYGDLLLKGNAIVSSTVLMRREMVQRIGKLNSELRYTHDYEYWIRAANNVKIGFLARPVLYYRTNLQGASSLNRSGTFKEIALLLMNQQMIYKKSQLLRALLYQTKYNASLAFHDRKLTEMARILFHGARITAGLFLRGNKRD